MKPDFFIAYFENIAKRFIVGSEMKFAMLKRIRVSVGANSSISAARSSGFLEKNRRSSIQIFS